MKIALPQSIPASVAPNLSRPFRARIVDDDFKMRLEKRRTPALEHSQLVGVALAAENFVADLSQARGSRQSHTAGADY